MMHLETSPAIKKLIWRNLSNCLFFGLEQKCEIGLEVHRHNIFANLVIGTKMAKHE